jgi:hypothetical protein
MRFQCVRKAIGLASPAAVLVAGVLLADGAFAATVLPSKNHKDKCPANYHRDGDYCMPNKYAKKGIKKSGKCPSGYFADGNFCMKVKK